jgi:hypothetical protein
MSSRIRVLAVSAIVLLGMTAQAQACFWPFCCGGYGRPVAWGGPVGYGRPVAYRRGFYAGYYAASSCYAPCSTCGVGGCSTCGVSTYYAPSCCSTCGSACYGGCSTCGTGGCANCSTNYYPDGTSTDSTNDSNSTYSNSDEPTDATTGNPPDDDFGPGGRSIESTNDGTGADDADSIPDDFQTPIDPAGEPTNGEEPPMARPLRIGTQLTWQVLPTRNRVHVESGVRAPRIARVEAAPASIPDLSVLRVASFEE